MMRFGSICSGIGAAELAFGKLGWECGFMSEIEPFARSVLEERFGGKIHGDFTQIENEEADVLVGGTPCQSFSVAGQRAGIDDPRGNLTIEYARLVMRVRPRWFILENVPGILLSSGGADFATILAAFSRREIVAPGKWKNAGIVEAGAGGYGLAWRVYDAQYFGVCQRRRRCFVVGHLGDWRPPAALHFVGAGVRRDNQSSGKAGAKIGSITKQCANGADDNAAQQGHIALGFDEMIAGGCITQRDKAFTSRGGQQPMVVYQQNCGHGKFEPHDKLPVATAGFSKTTNTPIAVGFAENIGGEGSIIREKAYSPRAGKAARVVDNLVPRRLTEIEVERAMGFPDGWTDVEGATKTKRYKALGNSMAVPVMYYLGRRLEMVEEALPWRAEFGE